MFVADRHARLLEVLDTTGRVVSAEAAEAIGVSIDTVRRDLAELEASGHLRRVHGGAIRPVPAARRFAERLDQDDAARAAIASAAAATLPRDGLVAFGGGTTAVLVARRLPADFRGTVVTASPDVAIALREHPGVEVDVLGGRLDRTSQTITGPDAVAQLATLRPDACVIGSCGVDAAIGVTFHERDEAQVVRAMVQRSAWCLVLAAAAKLGTSGPYVVAAPQAIDVLVTDGPTEAFEALGIAVVRP